MRSPKGRSWCRCIEGCSKAPKRHTQTHPEAYSPFRRRRYGFRSRRARRRITLRLLPYVLLLYVIAYLDRTNLATAALQMPHDLGFDDRVIGLGGGHLL